MAPRGTQEGDDMWLNLEDPPGMIMAGIVWFLILYCDFVIIYIAIEYEWWDYYVVGFYNFFVFMSLWSHFMTMTSDPGAVTKDAFALATSRDRDTVCGRCDGYKPPYSHHCRICGRCIVRMDHHCPWMNNCIGALNQKYFVLFLVYICGQTITSITIMSIRLASCNRETVDLCFPGIGGKLVLALIIFTLFAQLFVISMLHNQFYAVRTGIGTIDRMKRRKNDPERSTKYRPIRWVDVFGNGPYYLWPIPTKPEFNNIDLVLCYSRRTAESLARGGGGDHRASSIARAAARGVSMARNSTERATERESADNPLLNNV